MISSAESGSGVRLVGIHPEDEKRITDIHNRVVEGSYLEGVNRNPRITSYNVCYTKLFRFISHIRFSLILVVCLGILFYWLAIDQEMSSPLEKKLRNNFV